MECFPPISETVQECPLSTRLFSIIREVLINEVTQEKEMKDIQISKGGKEKILKPVHLEESKNN